MLTKKMGQALLLVCLGTGAAQSAELIHARGLAAAMPSGSPAAAGAHDHLAGVTDAALIQAGARSAPPASPVPEPSLYSLLLTGLGMLLVIVRRGRNEAFSPTP